MTELNLVPERGNPNTKIIKGIASVTFEIEVPVGVHINPWDIKVNAGKGWAKLHTEKVKKPTRKMNFKASDKEESIFD